ncbi:MAG: hypothetical protein CMJ46_15350 [Planctomyces sp.]|nr:hypothetical protein [Planctomyces sp.]
MSRSLFYLTLFSICILCRVTGFAEESDLEPSDSELQQVTFEVVADLLKMDKTGFHTDLPKYEWSQLDEDVASALVEHWLMEKGNEENIMLQNATEAASDVHRYRFETGAYDRSFYHKWAVKQYLYEQGNEQVARLDQARDRNARFEELILRGIRQTVNGLVRNQQIEFLKAYSEETIPALVSLASDTKHPLHHPSVLILKDHFSEVALPAEVTQMETMAKDGDPEAQCYMGYRCYMAKQNEESFEWYRKAALSDFAEGQFSLGNRYHFGEGVKADSIEAFRWYQKAADQGHAKAQHNLGTCHIEGIGTDKDIPTGLEWLKKAAAQDYAPSAARIGIAYFSGESGSVDYHESHKWFVRSAKLGDATAQMMLGACYQEGVGCEKDHSRALMWMTKAAEQNQPVAQMYLGLMYATGVVTDVDLEQAAFWLNCAAQNGSEEAKTYLSQLF